MRGTKSPHAWRCTGKRHQWHHLSSEIPTRVGVYRCERTPLTGHFRRSQESSQPARKGRPHWRCPQPERRGFRIRDAWVAEVESRFPTLGGRVVGVDVPVGEDGASFRDAETAEMMRDLVSCSETHPVFLATFVNDGRVAWKAACDKAGCPGRIPHDLVAPPFGTSSGPVCHAVSRCRSPVTRPSPSTSVTISLTRRILLMGLDVWVVLGTLWAHYPPLKPVLAVAQSVQVTDCKESQHMPRWRNWQTHRT